VFTGLIEEVGRLGAIQGERLVLRCQTVLTNIALGDSISVDGVCLTVVHFDSSGFTAQVSDETLQRTNLSGKVLGSLINLERSLRFGGKVGGHFVTGHIDGTGHVQTIQEQGEFWEMTFWAPPNCRRYLASKGSIAVNGVSLTVAHCTDETFTVAVIPFSLNETNLYQLQPGDLVNLEGDILAKYVARMVDPMAPVVDLGFLAEHGYV